MAAFSITPQPTPDAKPLSQLERIVDTFIAPSKTFTDLRRSASWWAPWLLISAFSIAFIFVVGQQIGFEQVARNQISYSSRADQFDKLPPEQQARQLHAAAMVTKYIAYGFPAVLLLSFLLIAAVLMGTFNFGAGAQVRFGTALAIVAYGSLPGIIHATLGMISLFAGVDPEGFNLNNPVATNPAYFMNLTSSKPLYVLASGLDVFVIWNIVLMGIGFACNSKVKRGTAIGIVAGWFIFYKLLGVGLAAMF
jgi:Yip1 domain